MNKELNIYIVEGEHSDGTEMYSYSEFNVVAAENEDKAKKLDSNLLGKKRTVRLIGTTTLYQLPQVIEETCTRDY